MPHFALVTTDADIHQLIEPVVQRLKARLTIVPDADLLEPTEVDLIFWPLVEYSVAAAAQFERYYVPLVLLTPRNTDLLGRPQLRRLIRGSYTAFFPFDVEELAVVITQMLKRSVIQRFTERRLRKRYVTFVEPFNIPTCDDGNK